ncbi:MAG: VCBS repeat-containing protein, partial [Candidatus Fermentibacteraceae bacterium]|nr:VCBS repeat-containing protein [Candidatus Fermentibacteraceae bacterium]
MSSTAVLLSLLLGPVSGDFQHLISIRHFGSAMDLAVTDSLRAEVHRAAGADSAAAELYGRAFRTGPSPGLFARMWDSLSDCAADSGGSESRELREMLAEWGNLLHWQPAHLLSLVETASQLEDSALADSLTDSLLARYPLSEEAYQVLGWEFYDNLYPVWYDDSARIEVLMDFIDRRGDASDVWRSTAYRYALSAVLGTADSVSWQELHGEWMAGCPGDPQVYLTGAALLIDRDSSFSAALELADRGILLYGGNRAPDGMPGEEWALIGPAMEAGLQFRRLQALAGLGRDEEALAGLDSVLSRFSFDIDDCNTEASLLWLRGRILLNTGDTAAALLAFGRSAALGDVMDRWSGLSETEMEKILFPSRSPAGWAREKMGYDGPVFADVTPLLGPDSLLRGSRVSWCDWNSDGYPDLFAGSSLFQNECGTGFTDITGEAGLDSCRGNGGVWGDIDRDGRPDLVTAGNPVQVFMSGNGRLRESTSLYGIDSTGARVEGVALLDWNADGWLDLYLACYENPDEMGSGTADLFYLGGEDGFRAAG